MWQRFNSSFNAISSFMQVVIHWTLQWKIDNTLLLLLLVLFSSLLYITLLGIDAFPHKKNIFGFLYSLANGTPL